MSEDENQLLLRSNSSNCLAKLIAAESSSISWRFRRHTLPEELAQLRSIPKGSGSCPTLSSSLSATSSWPYSWFMTHKLFRIWRGEGSVFLAFVSEDSGFPSSVVSQWKASFPDPLMLSERSSSFTELLPDMSTITAMWCREFGFSSIST